VYTLGLPAQAFAARPRAIESADKTTGVLALTGNGLFDGSLLRFTVLGEAVEGKPDAALPAGLSSTLMYTAAPVSGSSDLFRVAPVGGSVITSFGDDGAGVFSIVIDPKQTLIDIIADESAQIDNCLTAQAPPILPDPNTGLYPQILSGVVARRTAIRGALSLGLANPLYQASFDRLIAGQDFDTKRIEEWLEGRPIKPEVLDQNAVPDDAPRMRNGLYRGRGIVPWRGGCCG
jgi:hypothetical protein